MYLASSVPSITHDYAKRKMIIDNTTVDIISTGVEQGHIIQYRTILDSLYEKEYITITFCNLVYVQYRRLQTVMIRYGYGLLWFASLPRRKKHSWASELQENIKGMFPRY